MKFRILASVLLVTFTLAASAGAPSPTRYVLEWSDPTSGATATGFIELDRNIVTTPGDYDWAIPDPAVLDFEITITGASSGNGTFALADFSTIIFETNGGALDLDVELVGQATDGDPWGTPSFGGGGDFNIFVGGGKRGDDYSNTVPITQGAGPFPPVGTFWFEITTDGGSGEALSLISFRPADLPESVAVPSMSNLGLVLLFGGLLLLGLLVMQRKGA